MLNRPTSPRDAESVVRVQNRINRARDENDIIIIPVTHFTRVRLFNFHHIIINSFKLSNGTQVRIAISSSVQQELQVSRRKPARVCFTDRTCNSNHGHRG